MIPTAMLAIAYATGRVSHARQVKGDDPDKKGYPGPPGWGFGMGLATPHSKKFIFTKVEKKEKLERFKMMERVGDRWEKNGRILFDRPKPTVGCSASGRRKRRRRRRRHKMLLQYLTSNTNQIHVLRSTVPPETFNPKFAKVFGVNNSTNKIQHKIKT
jgi:hypothetical protein